MMGDVRTRAAVAALMIATAATVARADTGVVLVGGTVDATQRDAIEKASNDAATAIGWTAPRTPLTKKETDALLACSDPKQDGCAPAAMKSGALQYVYVVAANPETTDGKAGVFLQAFIIGATPPISDFDGRHCEQCAIDSIRASANDLATTLLRRAEARSGHTVLDLQSDPPGATVTDNGEKLGATDNEFPTYPGEHHLTFEKDGYLRAERTFTARENTTSPVRVKLTPSPLLGQVPQGPQAVAPRWERPLGKSLVGAGLVGLAGGITLVAINQSPSPTGPRNIRKTATGGYTLAALSLVGIGVGGFLWGWSKYHYHSVPIAALVPGGGVIGLSGTF